MRTLVIGAGLSGLAAAHRLMEAGHEVIVLESCSSPGGRCRHIEREGFLIDTGPDLAVKSYERYLALVQKVGLEKEIIPTSTVSSFIRHGKPIDIDAAKPVSAALTPLLSWPAKIRLALGFMKHRNLVKQAHAYELVELEAYENPAVSAGEFARTGFGQEAAEYLIDAALRPLGGTHMDQLSSLLVIGAMASWTEPMITIRGGLYRVADMAAKQLDVIYNAKVSKIKISKTKVSEVNDAGESLGQPVEVEYLKDGQINTRFADGCVVATQYHEAENIFPTFKKLAGTYGEQLRYCRLMDIKVAFDAPTQSKAYAVFVPTRENSDLLMYSLIHNKAPDRAPPGKSLFTLYTDDAVWERFQVMSDEQIIEWGRQQMESYYPELRGKFKFGYIQREPQTANFADCSFYTRTAKLIDGLGPSNKVQLAGDFFAGGSMEAAVIWGEHAADRLMGGALG